MPQPQQALPAWPTVPELPLCPGLTFVVGKVPAVCVAQPLQALGGCRCPGQEAICGQTAGRASTGGLCCASPEESMEGHFVRQRQVGIVPGLVSAEELTC